MTELNGFSDLNGFATYAQLISESGSVSLVHNGHKFIRDRVENVRSYWRCRNSFRYNCKARMVTKLMENGQTMMKVRHGEHDHTVKKVAKNARKQLQSKPHNLLAFNRNMRVRKRLLSKTFTKLTKLPELIPKSTLIVHEIEPKAEITADTAKNDENVGIYSPVIVDDPENDIVEVLY